MGHKDKLTNSQELIDNQDKKTALNNQWNSLTQADECNKGAEKTATDNQWVSTNKNVK